MEVRKQVADEKKEIFITGGGKRKDIISDPSQDILLSIMNTKTVFGLENPLDSNNDCDYAQDTIIEYDLEADFHGPLMGETIELCDNGYRQSSLPKSAVESQN